MASNDFNTENKELDKLLEVIIASSPQPEVLAPAVPIVLVVVAAPAPTIKLPTCGWFQVPFLRRIVIPAPPARAAWVPSPQGVAKSLDEIFNGISFDEVKVPRIYPWPHHLLPYNLESNHLMLSHHSNDLSRSVCLNKYMRRTKEEQRCTFKI